MERAYAGATGMSAPGTMRAALQPTVDAGWLLNQQGFDLLRDSSQQSRFAISNGFLGVRGGSAINRGRSHLTPSCTYVAGLFDVEGEARPIPALVPVADWLRVGISFPGQPAAEHLEQVSGVYRTLDMKRGALLTGGRLARVPGLTIDVRVLRLVSLSERTIGLQLIQLDIQEGDIEVMFEASFDGLEFGLAADQLGQDIGVWRTKSSGKRVGIASTSSMRLDGEVLIPSMPTQFTSNWTWRTRPGQVACFERFVAVTRSDAQGTDPGPDAHTKLDASTRLGWRKVLDVHALSWDERWRCSDVVIEGDPAAQQALRFAAYHLNGAANPGDNRVSVGARALTGPDYNGHVFWDTEIYLLPFYSLTWPEAARALLMYRHGTLNAARAKAAGMGWRGAMFAWESADTGEEATPEHAVGPDRKIVDILCGKQEQHITADVAYAVWQYWQASGDESFLRDAGAEILLEAGRFWSSRARLEADSLHHVRGVIGPDEYHEGIDDNAFTNVMARWTIRRALEVAALMRETWPDDWSHLSSRIKLDDVELKQWRMVAADMATGLDQRSGLFEQFEGYFGLENIDLAGYAGRSVPMDVVLGRERIEKSQVVKQADVVALLGLLPEEFAGDTGTKNFAYYEPRCSHGSSLSRPMHGLVAARLGRSAMALDFFRQTSAIDLADTHAAIDGGVHIAALGGVWMVAVLGFAGLALLPNGIGLDPRLPEGWTSLMFGCQWRGRRLRVCVGSFDTGLQVTLEIGEPMTLVVQGKEYWLDRSRPLKLDIGKPA